MLLNGTSIAVSFGKGFKTLSPGEAILTTPLLAPNQSESSKSQTQNQINVNKSEVLFIFFYTF